MIWIMNNTQINKITIKYMKKINNKLKNNLNK